MPKKNDKKIQKEQIKDIKSKQTLYYKDTKNACGFEDKNCLKRRRNIMFSLKDKITQ